MGFARQSKLAGDAEADSKSGSTCPDATGDVVNPAPDTTFSVRCPGCDAMQNAHTGTPPAPLLPATFRCLACRTQIQPIPDTWTRPSGGWMLGLLPGLLAAATLSSLIVASLASGLFSGDDAVSELAVAMFVFGLGLTVNITLWLTVRRTFPYWSPVRRRSAALCQWVMLPLLLTPCAGVLFGLVVPGAWMIGRAAGPPADMLETCGCCGYDRRATSGACPECGREPRWTTSSMAHGHLGWIITIIAWTGPGIAALTADDRWDEPGRIALGIPLWLFKATSLPFFAVALALFVKRPVLIRQSVEHRCWILAITGFLLTALMAKVGA
ncbi:MAG: hypothetical protein AB8G96_15810 [Phycisphaerales bacterium]